MQIIKIINIIYELEDRVIRVYGKTETNEKIGLDLPTLFVSPLPSILLIHYPNAERKGSNWWVSFDNYLAYQTFLTQHKKDGVIELSLFEAYYDYFGQNQYLEFEGSFKKTFGRKGKLYVAEKINFTKASFDISYNIMTLDIETTSQGVVLVIGTIVENSEEIKERVFADTNASIVLQDWLNFYHQEDIDVIEGFNIINFDLRILNRNYLTFFSKNLPIGPLQEKYSHFNSIEQLNLEIPGVLIWDHMLTYWSFGRAVNSLDALARRVLKRKKEVIDVTNLYYELIVDKEKVISYCIHDVRLTRAIRTETKDYSLMNILEKQIGVPIVFLLRRKGQLLDKFLGMQKMPLEYSLRQRSLSFWKINSRAFDSLTLSPEGDIGLYQNVYFTPNLELFFEALYIGYNQLSTEGKALAKCFLTLWNKHLVPLINNLEAEYREILYSFISLELKAWCEGNNFNFSDIKIIKTTQKDLEVHHNKKLLKTVKVILITDKGVYWEPRETIPRGQHLRIKFLLFNRKLQKLFAVGELQNFDYKSNIFFNRKNLSKYHKESLLTFFDNLPYQKSLEEINLLLEALFKPLKERTISVDMLSYDKPFTYSTENYPLLNEDFNQSLLLKDIAKKYQLKGINLMNDNRYLVTGIDNKGRIEIYSYQRNLDTEGLLPYFPYYLERTKKLFSFIKDIFEIP